MYSKLYQTLESINVFTKKGQINKQANRILTTKFPNTLNEIYEATSFLSEDATLRARLYCVKHNITYQPVCKVCNSPVHFNPSKNRFNTYCPNLNSSCAALDPDLQRKRLQTIQHRYGVSNPGKNKKIILKRKKTINERYGCDVPIHNEHIKAKMQQTVQSKYGVNNVLSAPAIIEKKCRTMEEKYGARTYAESKVPKTALNILNSKNKLTEKLQDFNISEIAEELQVSRYLVSKYIKIHSLEDYIIQRATTAAQRQIALILDQHNIDYILNDRSTIYPHELDIYIPSLNLAIECDGIFYHSELSGRDKNYHKQKTLMCRYNNIQLLHVWSSEWETKRDIVISRILHALNFTSNSIYARECNIQIVDKSVATIFFNNNHIQGHNNASLIYGLFYNNKLVAAMSFGKARFGKKKKYSWELIRYASLINSSVVGGASKLFKRFIIDNNPDNIISYCDLRWGYGGVYQQLGFSLSHVSGPNYFYFVRNGDTNKLMSRVQFQKHKLATKLDNFNPNLTEWENMQNHGYDRIWDCGNQVWVWSR